MQLRKRAFTLMELLAVMLIIGLVVGLVVKNFGDIGESSKVKTAFAQMQTFKDVVDTYKLDYGKFPESLDELISGKKKYLRTKELPKDPWGNDYVYSVGGDMGFDIVCYGNDGSSGGSQYGMDVSCWDTLSTKLKEIEGQ